MDSLVTGIGEIIGSSQRADNFVLPDKRRDEFGPEKESYGFCMDLQMYGSARHAGFDSGFEHCVTYLTGVSNIRDGIPFPGTVTNCEL